MDKNKVAGWLVYRKKATQQQELAVNFPNSQERARQDIIYILPHRSRQGGRQASKTGMSDLELTDKQNLGAD